jgi:hypothetical protein
MENPTHPDLRIRRTAVIRIILGNAQMFGAVLAVVLLLLTGINGVTLGVAAATALLTVTSLILWRGR